MKLLKCMNCANLQRDKGAGNGLFFPLGFVACVAVVSNEYFPSEVGNLRQGM